MAPLEEVRINTGLTLLAPPLAELLGVVESGGALQIGELFWSIDP
jgi:hypothetical protein